MFIKIIWAASIFTFFIGCNRVKQEDPYKVAENYCNCVEKQMKQLKDSLIDIYDCEKNVFPDSRLMKIYMTFDEYNKYSQSTIDSAKKFSTIVFNLIDTMCLNKFDPKRIKTIPHIPM